MFKIFTKITHFFVLLLTFLLFPSFASAQNTCIASLNNFGDIVTYLVCLINKAIIPLTFSVALLLFFIGVVRFIANSSDETKRKEGQNFMLWGIIALFVMLSIWGILSVLANTFQVGPQVSIPRPQFQAP